MKWEPTRVHGDFCYAHVFVEPNLLLTMKGVPFGHTNVPALVGQMVRPLHQSRMQSRMPSLARKSLPGSRLVMQHNVQAVVRGGGYKSYQWR